ncbi:MAG: GNAT family N-acetyltransferase [Gemmatimonadota bacterium]|nr:GNAT family N-acetyltransferase [Gemmatimonadota bacterium]
MHFEPLRASDRQRVSDILIATDAFAEDEIAVALELFDEVHARVTDPHAEGTAFAISASHKADYELVGAYDDEGLLLGYACFGPTPSTNGTYDLYWLAVHPEAQGRGAGRQLVRWVEQHLARRGARLLVVETSSRTSYTRTREFYTRAGYAETARVRDFYAPADDRIIFTTRLAARAVGAATP